MHDTRDLTKRLAELLRREHGAMADFLLALADFDQQRRWIELGYASLFHFLHRELGLSKGAAFYRKTAAELVRRYPEIVEPLRDGRLCITSIAELAKVITPENRDQVIARFFHASKREAQVIAAELRPLEAAPHRDVITTVDVSSSRTSRDPVAPVTIPAASVQPVELNGSLPSSARVISATPPVPPARATDETQPLTGELSRLHVTVSRRFLAKLAAARDALSHSHPGAGTEQILEAALDLLLEKDRKKKGLVEKPRKAPARPSSRPRRIPAEVKRAVWSRDGGKCQWPVAPGGVCGSTTRLEVDHRVPIARGGASTIDNLRLLCGAHNLLSARQVFGDAWIDRCTDRVGHATTAGVG